MMGSERFNWGRTITYGGAFIAFLIGSGFATGQEVIQYFSGYGYLGLLGVLMVFLMFLYVGVDFVLAGYNNRFHKGSEIFRYYCGDLIGSMYDYFAIAFIFMSFVVMIGGASAAVNQQYGLPGPVGGVAMGVLAGLTVIFGLGRLIEIIGKIGPLIVIATILLGGAAIMMNPQGLAAAGTIPQMDLLRASTNWFFAALSYVGFCMLWLAGFMASLGAASESRRESIWGAVLGALGFSLALAIITLGIMANIEDLAGSQVPNLLLANKIHPTLGTVFSVTVVAGIYTTAVPLLWQVVARFSEEKTTRFTAITLALAAIGTFVGIQVPFDRLVNIIYVINGYVGIILLGFMIVKTVRVNLLSRADKAAASD